MKAKLSSAKHRDVVEMDNDQMKMLTRVARKINATTWAGAIRQLISEADRRNKK